jgi:HEAT repeat protein
VVATPKSPSGQDRRNAEAALRGIADQSTVQEAVPFLSHESASVRAIAVEMLGRAPWLWGELCGLLEAGEPNEHIRMLAAHRLSDSFGIGEPSPRIDDVMSALISDPESSEVRRDATFNFHVRCEDKTRAVRELGRVFELNSGSESANDQMNASAAMNGLLEVIRKNPSCVSSDDPVVEMLCRHLLEADFNVQGQLARTLMSIGSPAAIPFLREVIESESRTPDTVQKALDKLTSAETA